MIEKKNILYISYDGMTDPLGQSQVIPYLAGLTKLGYSFTVLSCEKPEVFKKSDQHIKKIMENAGLNWHPIFYTKRPPVLSTLYDFYKLTKDAEKLHAKLKFSATHCRSYISALVGQRMKKKHRIPFIFDMRGFWADERVDGGLWNLKKPLFKTIYKFFKRKEIDFLNESDAIVSLTYAAKAEIMSWPLITFSAEKISVIPCCVDTQLFDPATITNHQITVAKANLNLHTDNIIIGYLGSIGTWYLLDDMMVFFAALKNRIDKTKFLFVTQHDKQEIMDSAVRNGVNINDIIITPAARKDIPVMISMFNLGLFFIKPAYSKLASSPVKQGEIMAMGVPVISNPGVGDTDNILYDYNAGVTIPLYSIHEKAYSSILRINKLDPSKIRRGAEDYFSLDKGINTYYTIYNKLTATVN